MPTFTFPDGHQVTAPSAAADTVTVVSRRDVAHGVIELRLQRPGGGRLPDWAPGAHIDLLLDDGAVRQYSLCGDRWDAATYTIAVQREPCGRGGSVAIHDSIAVGSVVRFGGPRNNFRLAPAPEYLFIAGGIGITPLLPMIRGAELAGAEWRLLYLGRSRRRMAYLDELSPYGARVTMHCSDERGRIDLDTWRPRDARVRTYACGPERLLDSVAAWGAVEGGWPPKVERFAATASDSGAERAFEVVATRTGATVTVDTGETVVAALRRAGVSVLTSCAQGVCGTCETRVVAGTPDHRDALLDDDERTASDSMYPCVSRCRGERLLLDL
ncbi:PDR/VanB family oxidoreductase [Microbacterium hominis]|uniref:Oxidoreductase n=1 Tax=Microbacterium hominis TaxID=162426 RepID=A0A7D4THD0_9MICO|nr:PDR/VanB family oxidoreductase [Microbacterium hominis]QKJ20800.1 oxidoreductase [Microbacterium hominis]